MRFNGSWLSCDPVVAHVNNLSARAGSDSHPFVPNTSVTSVVEVNPTQRQAVQRPPLEGLGPAGGVR